MKYFIHLPMKMEPIVSSETSAIKSQTPGNYPKRNKLHVMMMLRKFSLPFALASSFLLISTRFSFWSTVNNLVTNFALTRRIWSFSVKIWWQDPMLMPTASTTWYTTRISIGGVLETVIAVERCIKIMKEIGLLHSPTCVPFYYFVFYL